ncbi:hypothetical protein AAFN86_26930 [Roseomonas sp. CAU 1739]|uniref:hypothetical protein n=1 Tax=Roseomonas sp. CAU 1739 TaxID=3140364 RepID=UPI00325BCFCC
MSLEDLFARDDRLPLNRKERYYAATVLPGIICTDGLQRLLQRLGRSDVRADLMPDSTNTQLFTEYDLRDAIRGRRNSPHGHLLPQLTGDTPDVVILIDAPNPLLLVLEAKLFSSGTPENMAEQLRRQREYVVEPLKEIVGGCDALQIALVPASLAEGIRRLLPDSPAHQTLTWEEIAYDYRDVAAASYWVRLLRHALGWECWLRAVAGTKDDHADSRMTAAEILEAHSSQESPIGYVGVGRAVWRLLQDDVVTSGGTVRLYAVSYAREAPSRNYIPVDEFVSTVRAWLRHGVPRRLQDGA